MRPVAIGDVVTWGIGSHGYRVTKVVETGVYVDGERGGHGIFFVPWGGDGSKKLRFLCGDRIDCMASFATRLS